MESHELVRELIAHAERIEAGETLLGNELAHVLMQLAKREVEEGGPYALDPVGDEIPRLDLGFNLAVAWFLMACEVELPRLVEYLDEVLDGELQPSSVLSDDEVEELAALYRRGIPVRQMPARVPTHEEEGMFTLIRTKIRERLEALPTGFRDAATAALERTIARNSDLQMALMPYYVRQALGAKGRAFTDDRIAELGLANIFFWTAFIIYDDFWDEDEAAEAELLPVANLFARHYIDTFIAEADAGVRHFFHSMMDCLDCANTWEVQHCRMRRERSFVFLPETSPAYGDYEIKFYPAAGHVMGAVLMLVELGYDTESKECKDLLLYFKHYLVAMQINDDAHDWKEDLERGHISTAIAELITAWKLEHPETSVMDLDRDKEELERLFWFKVLAPLCETALAHTKRSGEALDRLSLLEHPEPLAVFIKENERIARTALTEERQSEGLAAAFQKRDA